MKTDSEFQLSQTVTNYLPPDKPLPAYSPDDQFQFSPATLLDDPATPVEVEWPPAQVGILDVALDGATGDDPATHWREDLNETMDPSTWSGPQDFFWHNDIPYYMTDDGAAIVPEWLETHPDYQVYF